MPLGETWGAGEVLGAGGTPSARLVDESGVVASEEGGELPAVLSFSLSPALVSVYHEQWDR